MTPLADRLREAIDEWRESHSRQQLDDGAYAIAELCRLNRDELLAALAKAAEREWIDAARRQPECTHAAGPEFISDIVLCYWPNGWTGTGSYCSDGEWSYDNQDDGDVSDSPPTHWQPLPTAPRKEE